MQVKVRYYVCIHVIYIYIYIYDIPSSKSTFLLTGKNAAIWQIRVFYLKKWPFWKQLHCFEIPGCGLDTSRWSKTTHCDCPSLVEEGGDSRGTRLDEVFFPLNGFASGPEILGSLEKIANLSNVSGLFSSEERGQGGGFYGFDVLCVVEVGGKKTEA